MHELNTPPVSLSISRAVSALGAGPLEESALVRHVAPLFSRVLAREEIYLANHSLGRPLDQTRDDVLEALDLWYSDMDRAWEAWLGEQSHMRARLALLLGLSRADAVVPKTSAGQGLRAVLNALPAPCPTVVATRGEFDSIDFILKTYQLRGRAEVNFVEPRAGDSFDPADVLAQISPDTDLVVVSSVFYASGRVMEGLAEIIAEAHRHGAVVLLDTYHALGVMPVAMEALGADFAIGGSYKYLRGGTGACFLAVHPRHLDPSGVARSGLRTLDTGWFAKRDTFKYQRPETPELSAGGDAWLESTPPVLIPYQCRAGLQLTLALGVERLRAYTLGQLAFFGAALRDGGVPFVGGDERHGAFLRVPTRDTGAFVARLKDRGLNADARLGHVRFCPDILTTRDELGRAASIIAQVSRDLR